MEPSVERTYTGNMFLQCVAKFYVGDLTSAVGTAEAITILRVRGEWKKFQESIFLLPLQGGSLHTEDRLTASYVKSAMVKDDVVILKCV